MWFFWRMFQGYAPSLMGIPLSSYSGALPKWGMMRNGDIFELQTLALRTDGNGSSSWPTPSVNGNHNYKGASPTSGDELMTVVKQWRTPNARDHHPSQANQDRPDAQLELAHQVGELAKDKLNPDWVEPLMGYPTGWTDINFRPRPVNRLVGSRPEQLRKRKTGPRELRRSAMRLSHR